MELMNIKMDFNGAMCYYEPQLDITPYEVALNHMLITVAMNTKTTSANRAAFIAKYNLHRHWVIVSPQGPKICPEC